MLKGPFVCYWKDTIKLSFPIMLSFFSAQAMEIIDNIMVGNLGVVPLAATAFANSIVNMFVTVGLGFSSALSVVVARAYMQGKHEECSQYARASFCLNILIGLMMLVILEGLLENLHWFGQPSEVSSAAKPYFRLISLSVIPAILFQVWKQFTDGLGDTLLGSLALVASLILNIFFNWLLIYGHAGFPALGIAGAGWGTLLSRVVLAIGYYLYLRKLSRYAHFDISLSSFGSLYSKCRQLLVVAVPSSMQYLFEIGVFSAATVMVGWMGATSLASHQIALKVASTCFMLPLSLSFAASIRVGQAIGQKNPLLAWKLGSSTVLLTACLMSLTALGLFLGKKWIPYAFIDAHGVVELASSLLLIAAIFQIFDGTQAVAVGALRGLLDTKVPSFLTFLAYWLISFPAAYWLGFPARGGVHGVWYGLMLGLACSSIFLNTRFFLLSRRFIRQPESLGQEDALGQEVIVSSIKV